MKKEEFIEKYQPGVVTTNGIMKDHQWLVDFHAVLTNELDDTMSRLQKKFDENIKTNES